MGFKVFMVRDFEYSCFYLIVILGFIIWLVGVYKIRKDLNFFFVFFNDDGVLFFLIMMYIVVKYSEGNVIVFWYFKF